MTKEKTELCFPYAKTKTVSQMRTGLKQKTLSPYTAVLQGHSSQQQNVLYVGSYLSQLHSLPAPCSQQHGAGNLFKISE